MHLIDLVKRGQTLPAKLTPDLVPPSYRKAVGVAMTSHAVGIPPGGLAPGIGTVMPTVPGNILNDVNSSHKLDLLGLALHCMAENYESLFWFSSVSNH